MPPGLAEFFVAFLTEPGDLVFDPFGGSNVTGAAAEKLQRRWITVEPDTDYVLGSLGRFGNAKINQESPSALPGMVRSPAN
jgi:site-specific DNA-methyltransferase (cytosine-N4-specific)